MPSELPVTRTVLPVWSLAKGEIFGYVVRRKVGVKSVMSMARRVNGSYEHLLMRNSRRIYAAQMRLKMRRCRSKFKVSVRSLRCPEAEVAKEITLLRTRP